MNDKEWYEGKSLRDLEGLHVSVVYDDGSRVEGRLNDNGQINTGRGIGKGVNDVFCQKLFEYRTVLTEGVKSVSLIWDERDWKQIEFKDLAMGDAVVVNGSRIRICATPHGDGFVRGTRNRYYAADVSCSLRRRYKLPTKPGAYKGTDGALLFLTKVGVSGKWVYVLKDFSGYGTFIGDEQAEEFLPLTPIHFVDGEEQGDE